MVSNGSTAMKQIGFEQERDDRGLFIRGIKLKDE
jgi:hypothetical protein